MRPASALYAAALLHVVHQYFACIWLQEVTRTRAQGEVAVIHVIDMGKQTNLLMNDHRFVFRAHPSMQAWEHLRYVGNPPTAAAAAICLEHQSSYRFPKASQRHSSSHSAAQVAAQHPRR